MDALFVELPAFQKHDVYLHAPWQLSLLLKSLKKI